MDQMPVEAPPPEQAPQATPKKGISLTTILSVLLLLATAIAFFFYFQNAKLRDELTRLSPPPQETPTPTATPEPSPTESQTPSSLLLPTTGWVMAENGTFSVKYPGNLYEPQVAETSIYLKRKDGLSAGPNFLVADNYTGGSRREWYLDYYSYSESDVGSTIFFTEKTLGSVSVLEVAAPTSKDIREILVTGGGNLVVVSIQDPAIPLVETIVSTIKFK